MFKIETRKLKGKSGLFLEDRDQILDFLPILREILNKTRCAQINFSERAVYLTLYVKSKEIQEIFNELNNV